MAVIPYILCLETSGKSCSVCLSAGDRIIALREEKEAFSHAKVITLLIEKVLSEGSINIKELSAISLSAGPGSYTSLRVGSSVAKAICFAMNVPLIAIPTLEIIADSTQYPAKYIISTINARRGNLYWGIYDKYHELVPTTFSSSNEFLKEINNWNEKDIRLTGSGLQAFQQTEIPDIPVIQSTLNAGDMVSKSFDKYRDQKWEELIPYRPMYIRPPHITTPKKTLLS